MASRIAASMVGQLICGYEHKGQGENAKPVVTAQLLREGQGSTDQLDMAPELFAQLTAGAVYAFDILASAVAYMGSVRNAEGGRTMAPVGYLRVWCLSATDLATGETYAKVADKSAA